MQGADVSPSHNSHVSQQPWLQNAAEQQEDGQSFSDTSHLIYEPQTDHRACFIGSPSAVKGLHCCKCRSELKTSSFSSPVWCRVPWGRPSSPWRSSGTISQWTPQLKIPSDHTLVTGAPRKSSPALLAGLCLLCEQRGWIRASHWRPRQTPVPWQGLCSETGQGTWLTLGSFSWVLVEVCILSHYPTTSSDTCEPFTSSHCHLP